MSIAHENSDIALELHNVLLSEILGWKTHVFDKVEPTNPLVNGSIQLENRGVRTCIVSDDTIPVRSEEWKNRQNRQHILTFIIPTTQFF